MKDTRSMSSTASRNADCSATEEMLPCPERCREREIEVKRREEQSRVVGTWSCKFRNEGEPYRQSRI